MFSLVEIIARYVQSYGQQKVFDEISKVALPWRLETRDHDLPDAWFRRYPDGRVCAGPIVNTGSIGRDSCDAELIAQGFCLLNTDGLKITIRKD